MKFKAEIVNVGEHVGEGDQIIGYTIKVGLEDEEMPIEDALADLSALARSAVVSIFSGDILLFRSLVFTCLDDGVFSKFIPITCGKPGRVTVTFPYGAKLSRPRVMYAEMIEVYEIEEVKP